MEYLDSVFPRVTYIDSRNVSKFNGTKVLRIIQEVRLVLWYFYRLHEKTKYKQALRFPEEGRKHVEQNELPNTWGDSSERSRAIGQAQPRLAANQPIESCMS